MFVVVTMLNAFLCIGSFNGEGGEVVLIIVPVVVVVIIIVVVLVIFIAVFVWYKSCRKDEG